MSLHRVVALLNPPQSPFELGCAAEVFGTVLPDVPSRYGFGICAERPGPLRTTIGYPMLVDAGLSALEEADTVVVPGWQPPDASVPPTVIAALRAAHRRGARIVAICTGAFVLAHAGLLDGRRASTHWRHTDRLAATFPQIEVDPDVLYVDHGDVATSAGTGAGIGQRQGFVRNLRGDGDELSAAFGDGGMVLLEGAQSDVAVRAPGTAVEGEHDRALGEEPVEGDGLTSHGGQREARGMRAGGESAVGLAGGGEFGAGPLHDLAHLGGDLLLAGFVEGAQFCVEGHEGGVLPVWGQV